MIKWINRRSAGFVAAVAALYGLEKVAKSRFRANDYEGPWGAVALAAFGGFVIIVIVAFGVVVFLQATRRMRSGDYVGAIVLGLAMIYLAQWVLGYLRFAYPTAPSPGSQRAVAPTDWQSARVKRNRGGPTRFTRPEKIHSDG